MDLMYSLSMLSSAGALPFLRFFMHLLISVDDIFAFRISSVFSIIVLGYYNAYKYTVQNNFIYVLFETCLRGL